VASKTGFSLKTLKVCLLMGMKGGFFTSLPARKGRWLNYCGRERCQEEILPWAFSVPALLVVQNSGKRFKQESWLSDMTVTIPSYRARPFLVSCPTAVCTRERTEAMRILCPVTCVPHSVGVQRGNVTKRLILWQTGDSALSSAVFYSFTCRRVFLQLPGAGTPHCYSAQLW